MNVVVSVTFDGEVFRPDEPIDLKINQRYLMILQPIDCSVDINSQGKSVLERLEAIGSLPGFLPHSTGNLSDRDVRHQRIHTYLKQKHDQDGDN